MDIDPAIAAQSLVESLGSRGWIFTWEPDRVIARKRDWPAQLHVLIDFGTRGDAALALVIDMANMPLGGERFRDMFNRDRELPLRGFGNFRVRQFLVGGEWARDLSDNAFVYGATTGISRTARLVFFDRRPVERGAALVERFIAESNRLLEAGNQIGSILQRVYQRTVLGASTPSVALPSLVPAISSTPLAGVDGTFPWR